MKIVEQNITEFKIGDKCFAKLRGYSYWPAKIKEINGLQFKIFFYGTNDHAFLLKNCVLPFDEFTIQKHGNSNRKKLKKQFDDAMKAINQDKPISKTDDLNQIKEAILKTKSKTMARELKTETLRLRNDKLTQKILSIEVANSKAKIEVSKLKMSIKNLKQNKRIRGKDFKLEIL